MFRTLPVFTLTLIIGFSGTLAAGEPSPVQSDARPKKLTTIGLVQIARSDERAERFYTEQLPELRKLIVGSIREKANFNQASTWKLESDKLFLRQQTDLPMRVYFVGSVTAASNSLGLSFTPAGSLTAGQPRLVFPNSTQAKGARTNAAPLVEGDFVEIGHGGNGYQLDFFMINNGARGGGTWLWNNSSKNLNNMQNVVAYHVPNSSIILIGFEDNPRGGDRDYNDCLFALDIGIENIEAEYPH